MLSSLHLNLFYHLSDLTMKVISIAGIDYYRQSDGKDFQVHLSASLQWGAIQAAITLICHKLLKKVFFLNYSRKFFSIMVKK